MFRLASSASLDMFALKSLLAQRPVFKPFLPILPFTANHIHLPSRALGGLVSQCWVPGTRA